ncbi:hypothetical protein AWRI1631_22090 [Saccharomyces cerevisiae AWRI1631]|uniref:Uncharacterized protein n=1 Tax=Saccharomyces cerevisiae (strain AWRI1631) TaxID=545124 RepID=B5VE86_YEAS6|nr:hypothetical protein AWRI1631_22090 [Saccharomyces cerevisiae AWRI1631]
MPSNWWRRLICSFCSGSNPVSKNISTTPATTKNIAIHLHM